MRKINYSILFILLAFSVLELALLLFLFLNASIEKPDTMIALVALSVIVLALLLFVFLKIYAPVFKIGRKIKRMKDGELLRFDVGFMANELDEISQDLGELNDRQKYIVTVLSELANGESEVDFSPISENDRLGIVVSKLKNSIVQSGEEAKRRRREDEQLNWASQGLASFSGMFRNFEQDSAKYAHQFMKELCTYLDVEIGGFYLKEQREGIVQYRMIGAYAFDREKSLDRVYEPGEGLVGRSVLEKEVIVMSEVPKEYVKIRSGLGEDLPATLVLLPVTFDDDVLAVIELASFTEVESYKIDFLESLASNIAGSLIKSQ